MWIICRYYAIYDTQIHIWVHGNDHALYTYKLFIFVEHNTELKPTDMHSASPVWRMVVIYYLVCSCLLHCKRIFPNSKEKNVAYLQMSVDQYLLNDMRQILINNIKIHMNVRCAEMMSSEIANLTILVEVQNAKTFYEKNM